MAGKNLGKEKNQKMFKKIFLFLFKLENVERNGFSSWQYCLIQFHKDAND